MRPVLSFFCIAITAALLHAQYPLKIGESHRADATAWNNARRIVRTSDDRRIVVYQDSLDGKSAVMWTSSPDGQDWSEPAILEYGACPAVAVSESNRVYAVWEQVASSQSGSAYLNEGQPEWEKSGVHAARFPCVDVVDNEVYIVFEWQEDIYFRQYDSTLENIIVLAENVSQNEIACSMPVVVTDIEYENNIVHILWNEEGSPGLFRIKDFKFNSDDKDWPYSGFYYWMDQCDPVVITELSGIRYPSASQRMGSIFFSGANENQELIHAMLILEDMEGCTALMVGLNRSREGTFPSIDDIGPKGEKCALVWQEAAEIMSGTLFNTLLVPESVQQLSPDNGRAKYFPSICYKTFREDSFDVVWTEGENGSYDILYGRYEKWPGEFGMFCLDSGCGYYKKACSLDFGLLGRYHSYNWEIRNLPQEFYEYGGGNLIYIDGIPEQSGTFELCFIFTTYNDPAWSDTCFYTLIIHNTAPQITSSDVIHAVPGERIRYRAEAVDQEDNDIVYSFEQYPHYLDRYIADIFGNIPADAGDTSFVVIATDGEKSDTLTVAIQIESANQIDHFNETPDTYKLHSSYPNPFNGVMTLHYQIPEAARVKIDVYNLQGEWIQSLADGFQTPGQHRIRWNGAGVPSGVYLIQMHAGKFSAKTKCLLVK